MNKKRILLGILIVMVMAVCSAFLVNVPSVFASETSNYDTIENEAGTFYGQGYYEIGKTATLTAVMNDGYAFDAWVSVDEDGNVIEQLSTDLEYTFVVGANINIKAAWHKKTYTISFADDLLDESGELKDFSATVLNADDIDGQYYYDDEITITLDIKSERYIYDLASSNIYINNVTVNNLPNVSSAITNDEKTGFDTVDITLNIRENITIDINYLYMYNFQITSGNDIPIANLIQFITVDKVGYYSQIDSYNYLVRADKEINIAIEVGNDVYSLIRHKYQNQEYSQESNQSFRLTTDSVFSVEYAKKKYNVTFSSYITNIYGEYDLMTTQLYNIPAVELTAGDSVTFEHDASTRIITINEEYAYATDTYGYKFVQFAINGEALTSNTYTLSETQPTDIEIQVIFEYIEYILEIRLVDNYFSDGVEYGYNYVDCTKLIKGSKVKLFATSTKYLVKGWSLSANPGDEDYLESDEIIFEPTGDADENRTYVIYLDVDYKYYSVEYKLNDSNIEQGPNDGEYIYFGQLQAGVVEYLTLSEEGDNVTVTLNGTIYTDGASTAQQVIQTLTTTKTYDDALGAYCIDNFPYSMYLYMSNENTAYSHIILRDVTYYYDDETQTFVLRHAEINTPEDIGYGVVKNSKYSISFSNLLPSTLIVYQTQSADTTNYEFTRFKDKTGSNLWSFDYLDARRCILNATSFEQVIVEYRKLANNITLNITNENAYAYDYIEITVDGGTPISGNTVVATNGQQIVITITTDYISKGYKFNGYYLNGEQLTTSTQLEITMSNDYINKTIDIDFSEIEYVIKVNYIDKDANVISQENANGVLKLKDTTDPLTTQTVIISGEYDFVATADLGYYVGAAYFGSNAYQLSGLIGNNASTATVTTWKLSILNFEEAIIESADIENNEVNLYVYFATHTYSIKVYFEISQNASSITYPSLYMNNVKQAVTRGQEGDDTVVTKYFATADGFEYNTNIELRVDEFMKGTTLKKWKDANGSQLTTQFTHSVTAINSNVTLTVVLEYISYSIEYVIVDEEGADCKYGRVTGSGTSIKMFDTVNYSAEPNMGYVLKEKYTYNEQNEKTSENIDSGFVFNPANFKIENGYKFKIYLAFGLKTIELSIENVVNGGLYHFTGKDVNTLATHTIERTRGETTTTLTDETGYQIQTNDTITMQINLSSIGLDLNHVKLGGITITTLSEIPYKLTPVNIYDGENIVGVYYTLQIDFAPSVIYSLDIDTALQNVLKVKTYNIEYTYNFINSQFGITLIRQYNNSTIYGDEDVQINIADVGFGSVVRFSYVYEGMNSELTNKFRVNGFVVAGIKQEATESYTLEDITLWEQIALSKYLEGSNKISVVLTLVPKITLANYTTHSADGGYLYERQYIGENQGLITDGEMPDVVVGGNFEVVIKYDTGTGFSDLKPTNVGEYPVKIIAKITSEDTQTIDVEFDEAVAYKITPAPLKIDLKTYTSANPVTKTYDGSSNLSPTVLVNDFVLDGLFDVDKDSVFIDVNRLSAKMSGSLANTDATLYDVSVFDIYLLDKSNNTATNYILSSGQNLVFTRIGKVVPKALYIAGFKVGNKVYDGTTDINVDVTGIVYEGKLETDSTQILTENLKFYLDKSSIGYDREVKLDWSEALVGADSTNYSITYEAKYVDIYPYELQCSVEGYGTVKLVDVDKLCLIPIEAELFANVYTKGDSKYRTLYSLVEREIERGQKLKVCYELVLRVGFVNQLVPQGLYIYLPKAKNTTKVIQVIEDKQIEGIDYLSQKDYTVLKAEKGEPIFTVITRTVYLPLWMIILIVIAVALAIGTIVFVFILIRRKTKNKYSAYDKI